jgi:hypothetical protein
MQAILSDAVTLIIATILVTIAAGLVAFSLLSGVRRTRTFSTPDSLQDCTGCGCSPRRTWSSC